MESNDVKRAIKLALTENPDKCITPKELEDAMIKTVDYVDETKTSLEKYVDEKLANVPDVPETPDVPGCECEPVEKKEPYVIVVEDIFNIPAINSEEEVNKVREALTDGAGVLVKFTDDIHVGDLFISGYETKDGNSLYATKRINGRKFEITCEWDFTINAHSKQVTFRCYLVYFNYRYGTANGYLALNQLLNNIFSEKAKGKMYGPVDIDGAVSSYNITIDNVSYSGSTVYLSGKILHLDYGKNVTLSINGKGEMSAKVDLPYTENPVKTEELYFNDGSNKVVPFRHPDLSTQPSILPYKFAGNYVYEQMIPVTGTINEYDYYKILQFGSNSEAENLILLDSAVSVLWKDTSENHHMRSGHDVEITLGRGGNFVANFKNLLQSIKAEYGESFYIIDTWVRLVWTTKPDMSGGDDYYYQQQQGSGMYFINKSVIEPTVAFASIIDGHQPYDSYTMDVDATFKMSDDGLIEFKEQTYFVRIYELGRNNQTRWQVTCEETGETFTSFDVVTNGNDMENGFTADYLMKFCPKTWERLLNGQAVHFILR